MTKQRFSLLIAVFFPIFAIGSYGLDFHSLNSSLRNGLPLPGGNTQLLFQNVANTTSICLAKINQNGELLDFKTYQSPYSLTNIGKLNFHYKHIYLLESVRINNKDYACVLKIDTNGNINKSTIFVDSNLTSATFQNYRLSNQGEPLIVLKKGSYTYTIRLDTNLTILNSLSFQNLVFADFLSNGELYFGKSFQSYFPVFQFMANYGTEVFKLDTTGNITYFNSYISQNLVPNQDNQTLKINSVNYKSTNELILVTEFPNPHGLQIFDDIPQYTIFSCDSDGHILHIPPYIRSTRPWLCESAIGEWYAYTSGFQYYPIVQATFTRFDSLLIPNVKLTWEIPSTPLTYLYPNDFDTLANEIFHLASSRFLSYLNLDSIDNSCNYTIQTLYPDTLPIFESVRNPNIPSYNAISIPTNVLAFTTIPTPPSWTICKCVQGSTGPTLDFDYCISGDSIFLQTIPFDPLFSDYDSVRWTLGNIELEGGTPLALVLDSSITTITLNAWNGCGVRTTTRLVHRDSTEVVQCPDTLLCPNQSILLQAETSHAYLEWYRNGEFIGNGNSFLANQSGDYSYTYRTSANCSQSSLPLRIEAAQALSPNLTYCTSQNQLTASVAFNPLNPIYDSLVWVLGGTAIYDSAAIQFPLIDSLFLSIWSRCENIHFAEKLVPDSTETIFGTASILCGPNDEITLYAMVPHNPLFWNFNGQTIDSVNLTIATNQPGSYSYSYWTDSNCMLHSQVFEIIQSNSIASWFYDSIQGILVANPTLLNVIWKDEFGNLVGTGPTFPLSISGIYSYEAVDSLGCTVFSSPITISLETVGIRNLLYSKDLHCIAVYNLLGEKLPYQLENQVHQDLPDGFYFIFLDHKLKTTPQIQKILIKDRQARIL